MVAVSTARHRHGSDRQHPLPPRKPALVGRFLGRTPIAAGPVHSRNDPCLAGPDPRPFLSCPDAPPFLPLFLRSGGRPHIRAIWPRTTGRNGPPSLFGGP